MSALEADVGGVEDLLRAARRRGVWPKRLKSELLKPGWCCSATVCFPTSSMCFAFQLELIQTTLSKLVVGFSRVAATVRDATEGEGGRRNRFDVSIEGRVARR